MVNERWLPVPGYEGLYDVSDQGRVRSHDRLTVHRWPGAQRRHRGRILKPTQDKHGHMRVSLVRSGRRKTPFVHTLVLSAFVGPRPDRLEGCHGNGIPSDNRLANLRWDTSRANKLDAVRHRTNHQTRKTQCPQGHDLAVQYGRFRSCRECPSDRQRAKRRAITHCVNGHELPPFREGKRRNCRLCKTENAATAA